MAEKCKIYMLYAYNYHHATYFVYNVHAVSYKLR